MNMHFMVFNNKSKHQINYKKRVKFQFERDLEFTPYGNPINWNTTCNSISYYRGRLTLHKPDDFHGGYYAFTDTLIYDYTFQDEPTVYNYKILKSYLKKHFEITFHEILKEANNKKTNPC